MLLVKDYQGKLIERSKARKIPGEDGNYAYYEMGISCIQMEDGLWYRTTTGKIIYDHTIRKWIHKKNFTGNYGLVEGNTLGYFSDTSKEVTVMTKSDVIFKRTQYDPVNKQLDRIETKQRQWNSIKCISEEVAIREGYVESIFDGCFYKPGDCSKEELEFITTPNIPASERNNVYSLDDDKEYRKILEDLYDSNNFKVEPRFETIARLYIPFTFGFEIETQNGWVPARIREPLGFRTCRDGSLDGGSEFVGIPMEGGKGLQAGSNMCKELTKRTLLSNKCSVHVHFGDVRRDKLYVISLWNLLYKIQNEFRHYFPYSRTNSIREDGKIYAALLPNLNLDLSKLLDIKDEAEFKAKVAENFNTIYTYLNAGHKLGEVYDEQFVKDTREKIIKGKVQRQYCYRVKKFNYTTRVPRHAVTGPKWNRPQRYYFVNLLNLFFSNSRTIEWRIMEATTNFDKILMYMITCSCILRYAENFKECFSNQTVTLGDILSDYLPEPLKKQIYKFWTDRKALFCDSKGQFKNPSWKEIEENYRQSDKQYTNKISIGVIKK